MHRFFLHNGEVREASDRTLAAGQVGLMNGWGVFSTVRVQDGILFAFERHWARMKRDADLLRVPFPWASPDALEAELRPLVDANQAMHATLRVCVVRNRGGMWEGPGIEREADLIAFTTDLKNRGDGVRLAVERQARHAASRFAGAKMLSWAQNLVSLEEAQAEGYDEVILLNERDEVSECTSANLFAAFGREVRTPPIESGCLPGVTREILLSEAPVSGYSVIEHTLNLESLAAADEVFITSTTRDLLPVISVEGIAIRSQGSARVALQEAFSRYTDEYVSTRRSKLYAS